MIKITIECISRYGYMHLDVINIRCYLRISINAIEYDEYTISIMFKYHQMCLIVFQCYRFGMSVVVRVPQRVMRNLQCAPYSVLRGVSALLAQ